MQNIDIRLKRSKKLTCLIIFMLLGSLFVILNCHIAWWLKGIFFILTGGYGIVVIRSLYALREIRHLNGNAWHLLTQQDQQIGDLMGDSTVTRLVCILRFAIPQKRLKQSFVLFNDCMQPEEYRRFIVYLKCYKP